MEKESSQPTAVTSADSPKSFLTMSLDASDGGTPSTAFFFPSPSPSSSSSTVPSYHPHHVAPSPSPPRPTPPLLYAVRVTPSQCYVDGRPSLSPSPCFPFPLLFPTCSVRQERSEKEEEANKSERPHAEENTGKEEEERNTTRRRASMASCRSSDACLSTTTAVPLPYSTGSSSLARLPLRIRRQRKQQRERELHRLRRLPPHAATDGEARDPATGTEVETTQKGRCSHSCGGTTPMSPHLGGRFLPFSNHHRHLRSRGAASPSPLLVPLQVELLEEVQAKVCERCLREIRREAQQGMLNEWRAWWNAWRQRHWRGGRRWWRRRRKGLHASTGLPQMATIRSLGQWDTDVEEEDWGSLVSFSSSAASPVNSFVLENSSQKETEERREPAIAAKEEHTSSPMTAAASSASDIYQAPSPFSSMKEFRCFLFNSLRVLFFLFHRYLLPLLFSKGHQEDEEEEEGEKDAPLEIFQITASLRRKWKETQRRGRTRDVASQ